MGIKGGPRIPKDGLVLSLDAANSKSFRGEPTTNLLSQPLTFETGYTYESWTTGEIDDNAIIAPDGTQTATRVKRVSGYFYKRNTTFPTFMISAGDIITFSCWVKKLDSSLTGGIAIWCYNNTSGPRAWSTEQIYNDRWVRQSVTYTAQTGETDFSFIFSGQYGTMLQGELAIWHPQVEIKSYATHFVNGTRGTTVAAAGGWADMTSNGNHGELINGASYDSGSLGALSFDGVNDYIDLGSDLSLSNECTFLIWFNSSDTSQLKYLMCKSDNTGYARDFFVGITSNARIDVWFGNSSSEYCAFLSPSNSYTINTWNNLVVTRDGSTCKVFINGVEKASASYSFTQNDNGHSLNIGSLNGISTGTRVFNGKVSSAQIYNRALTAEEIKNIYAATRGRFGL